MARFGGVRQRQQWQALDKIGYGPEITLKDREREREGLRMGKAGGSDEIDM